MKFELWDKAVAEVNGQFDATYQFRKAVCHVIAPKISEEENQRRIEEFQKIGLRAWQQILSKEEMV